MRCLLGQRRNCIGDTVAHKVRRYIHLFVASELVSDVEELSL